MSLINPKKTIGPQNDRFLPEIEIVPATPEEVKRYGHDEGDYDTEDYRYGEGHCWGCGLLGSCSNKEKKL